jgi:hypothetical protein
MQGIEKYRGEVAVEAMWLIENKVMSSSGYKQLSARHQIRVVRRGCKATPALVDYGSMPLRFKEKCVEIWGGEPGELLERKCLLREVLEMHEAQCKGLDSWRFFSTLTDKSGKLLEEDKIEKMTNSSKILRAISECLRQIEIATASRGQSFSIQREFEKFGRDISVMEDLPNNLPLNGRRLLNKWKDWKENGDRVLVHGLLGQEGNNKKYGEDIEAVVSEIVAQGNQLSDVMVAKILNAAGIEIDRRRVQAIRKKNEIVNMPQRKGLKAYDNTVKMQADRRRPSQPMLMWVSDGWDAELYYDNGKSKYNRLNIVMVIDAYNDYIMGYAIGERECSELIIEAYRDAIYHAEALFGIPLMPWQIQSDNYAKKSLLPYYSAICKDYTPARVGNAKEKVIEQYFRTIQSKLQLLPNYSGHNITAKKQLNEDFLNRNAKNGLIPDREAVIRQLQALVEVERAEKRAALYRGWDERVKEKVIMLDRGKYLLQFGEKSRGNMLTPNGLKLIREGKEYKYECFDIRMREMRGERWTICYDMKNMNNVLAVSEDRRSMFVLEAKEKVAMCIADVTEEDVRVLNSIGAFNKRLTAHITTKRVRNQELAESYISKHQLEGTLAGRLLTDGRGQHKDLKSAERAEKLRVIESDTERLQDNETTRQREEKVKKIDIYSKL